MYVWTTFVPGVRMYRVREIYSPHATLTGTGCNAGAWYMGGGRFEVAMHESASVCPCDH